MARTAKWIRRTISIANDETDRIISFQLSIRMISEGYTVFHLGLASEAAASIPVTFLFQIVKLKKISEK